jgi:hypothetical protein
MYVTKKWGEHAWEMLHQNKPQGHQNNHNITHPSQSAVRTTAPTVAEVEYVCSMDLTVIKQSSIVEV